MSTGNTITTHAAPPKPSGASSARGGRWVAAAALATGLVLAACGGSDSVEPTDSTQTDTT